MNDIAFQLPSLVTATIMLSCGATMAWLALNWFRTAGHKLHRIVWLAVLIQGIMLAKLSVELPVLDPETSTGLAGLIGEMGESIPSITPKPDDQLELEIPHEQSLDSTQIGLSTVGENGGDSQDNQPGLGRQKRATGYAVWIPLGWTIGVSALLMYTFVSYIRVLFIAKNSVPAPKSWSNQLRQLTHSIGLRSKIALLTHEKMGPALLLTPHGYRIIVPAEVWSRLGREQRAAILRHELEHLRRGDIFTSLFAFLVASVHWFNPFAWLAVRQLNASAEWACDAAATQDNEHNTDFARALLSISTSNARYLVGANGFGSSNLKVRIRRLLSRESSPTRFSKIALIGLTIGMVISGWVNFRLIAAPVIANSISFSARDDEELEKNISEMRSRLAADPLSQQLRDLAGSETGRIAISNSISVIENEMRNEAAKNIVPKFLETKVDDSFRSEIARETVQAKQDIRRLSESLDEIKRRFVGQTDADKLFARFLNTENASTVLYFGELRKQMRPGRQILMRNLGRFLAQDNDGNFIVRESAKAPLMERLDRYENVEEHLVFLRSELKLLGQELVAVDELHTELKKRLNTSRGAPIVLATAFSQETSLDDHISRYLQDLERYFLDGPDGLILNEDARDQLVNGMSQMDRLVGNMDRLAEPIHKIASQIDIQKGEEEKRVKNFLMSDIGLAVLSMQIDLGENDPTGITTRLRAEILQETDSGFAVREDRHEEIIEFSRRMLKGSRSLRRQLRVVDARTANLSQDRIGELLDSVESKLILVERIQEHTKQLQFDAWPTWVETHLEMVDDKYRVRSGSTELLKRLVDEAKAIEQELANDDF